MGNPFSLSLRHFFPARLYENVCGSSELAACSEHGSYFTMTTVPALQPGPARERYLQQLWDGLFV